MGSFSKHYDIVCHLATINKIDSTGNAGFLFDTNMNGALKPINMESELLTKS